MSDKLDYIRKRLYNFSLKKKTPAELAYSIPRLFNMSFNNHKPEYYNDISFLSNAWEDLDYVVRELEEYKELAQNAYLKIIEQEAEVVDLLDHVELLEREYE